MSLTVAKVLLGWNEEDERRHQQRRKSKLDAAVALMKMQEDARNADPRPAEEIIREQRSEWDR